MGSDDVQPVEGEALAQLEVDAPATQQRGMRLRTALELAATLPQVGELAVVELVGDLALGQRPRARTWVLAQALA